LKSMRSETVENKRNPSPFFWGLLFLFSMLFIYGIFYLFVPEKTQAALSESVKIGTNILWPLLVVFGVMMVLNVFIHPGRVVRFLGKEAGFRGLLLAAAAGILSMGPIYAWYPFLKDIREKGAGPKPIAVFLGNRAVKPVLLPVMVSYFGWLYTVFLTVFTFLGALAVGHAMGFFVKK
jgi:uncharacterized membrane protein YraQ (UPF0718 family)